MQVEVQPRTAVQLPVTFGEPGSDAPNFDPFAIPYAVSLSLAPVLERIEREIEGGDAGAKLLARAVLDRIQEHPELRQPITDLRIFERHKDLVELIQLFIVPAFERDSSLYKISLPFRMEALHSSPALDRLMDLNNVCMSFNKAADAVRATNVIVAGGTILRHCYGVITDMSPDAMLSYPCPHTTLLRYYRPTIIDDYVRVKVNGELPELSQSDINLLLSNIEDTELWLRLLPPAVFSFEGFHFSRMVEITVEESMSRLKHKLISRDAVLNIERVRELADLIRIHYMNAGFQLGLAAVDFPRDRMVDHEYRIQYNFLQGQVDDLTAEEYRKSIYGRAFRTREAVLVEDLAALEKATELEVRLLDQGIRSILVAPLRDKDKNVIGVVELASPEPFGINAFVAIRFEEIRALFRTAVARSREYVDNRIEAIMREQYTSLHASVEWRFTQAAFRLLELRDAGKDPGVPEEIVFNNIFPLYGQADIVGSSGIRNAAIYQDLFDNLRGGRHFLDMARGLVDFPIIGQVLLELDGLLKLTLEQFDNGQEVRLGDFIHRQLTPLIEQLAQVEELTDYAANYLANLDPDLGLYYRVRRDYETSVSRLNRTLSDFFTERDQASQALLPHYFEKYKTDGVEYELYLGQSLLKSQEFSEIHLRNFRLSQLVDMCEITRRVGRLSEELPMPLRTAQLIFVYSSPLDIRFRMDEKRFDVDGDYNIRYEILKKRIDKATIHKGKERLTQPGMVSIVFLSDRDETEYRGYLSYLQQSGYIDGEVETLVLDALQSVNGLRALRFKVRMELSDDLR